MKKYVITIIVSIVVVFVYKAYPIRLFSLDLGAQISSRLFNKLKSDSPIDNSILILNSGNVGEKEFIERIDSLLTYSPRAIGIILCDLVFDDTNIQALYANNPKIVMVSCRKNATVASSLIVEDDNSVTHFKTDTSNYFEITLTDSWAVLNARSNDQERINYRSGHYNFLYAELSQTENLIKENLNDKIILIGYVEFSLKFSPDMVYNFKGTHITPMNEYYGDGATSPDMYRTEISAHIISMLQERNFINETPLYVRILYILIISIFLTLLISVIQTRWILINLIIYLLLYTVFILGSTFLIVLAFEHNYYFEIPEISLALLVVMIITVLHNFIREKPETED